MRAVAVAAVLAALAAASCKPFDRDDQGVPAGYEGGAFPPAPNRQVFDDGGLVGGGGTGGMGGSPGPALDSGAGPPPRDTAVDPAPPPADAASGGGREAGDSTCDLLTQGCGANMGCYPAVAGMGRCMPFDPGLPAGSQCFEPANCAPGLTCASNTCAALCSTSQPNCVGGDRCVPLAAYTGVGYCLP